MILWIDPQQRAYGLAEDSTYAAQDIHAVAYPLSRDVLVEVDSARVNAAPVPATLPMTSGLRPPARFIAMSKPCNAIKRKNLHGMPQFFRE